MSNIKKLLEGIEVEWKTLGKVAKIKNGKDWKQLQEGNIPVYGSGGIMAYVNTFTYNKPTVLIPRKGSITNIFYVETPIWNVDTIYYTEIDTDLIAPKFFYYYLKTLDLMKLDTGSGRPSLTQAILNQIMIPIPCPDNLEKSLEIQKEIVRILDKFSTLTAELQAELQARKSQYEYYRNQLLTYPMEESDQPSLRSSWSASSIQNSDNPTQPFSTPNPHTGNSVLQPHNKVEWKTLGKIAEYSHKRINAATIMKTNYVGVDNLLQNKAGKTESNYVPTEGNLTAYTVGDILIGNIRPYLKKIWLADNNGGTNGDVLVIHLTDKSVDTRYLYQVLADDNFFVYNMQYAKGAKMPRGNKQKIMEYQIPIPYPNDIKKSLEEQERIASILDKFNKITTSITEGLPKEIELRQKQYEYYRDMLLTFPTDNIKA